MKRPLSVVLTVILVVACMLICAACQNNKDRDTDAIKNSSDTEKYNIKVGDEDLAPSISGKDEAKMLIARLSKEEEKDGKYSEENFSAYDVNVVYKFLADDYRIVTKVNHATYSFNDGIFKQEEGYYMPIEFVYVEDPSYKSKKGEKSENSEMIAGKYKFKEIIYPQDGDMYQSSLLKMAHGDQHIAESLANLHIDQETEDSLMENLMENAKVKGLTNFTYPMDEIPGYQGDIVSIKEGPNHIPGTTEIAKRSDYEKAKRNEENENWAHCDGVLYHDKTGIVIKTTIDYFD